jgi:hypothetical protein
LCGVVITSKRKTFLNTVCGRTVRAAHGNTNRYTLETRTRTRSRALPLSRTRALSLSLSLPPSLSLSRALSLSQICNEISVSLCCGQIHQISWRGKDAAHAKIYISPFLSCQQTIDIPISHTHTHTHTHTHAHTNMFLTIHPCVWGRGGRGGLACRAPRLKRGGEGGRSTCALYPICVFNFVYIVCVCVCVFVCMQEDKRTYSGREHILHYV